MLILKFYDIFFCSEMLLESVQSLFKTCLHNTFVGEMDGGIHASIVHILMHECAKLLLLTSVFCEYLFIQIGSELTFRNCIKVKPEKKKEKKERN